LIQVLIKDADDQPTIDSSDEDFAEDQNSTAAIVHLFKNEDPEALFQLFVVARQYFAQGGPKRFRHTLPPLIFKTLLLAVQTKEQISDAEEWAKFGKKLFTFVHKTVTALARTEGLSELALRLFLQCAQSSSYCGFETFAYEFISQALAIYEEEMTESKVQFNAIIMIVGTLQRLDCFSKENLETLTTKAAQYSYRLLKKNDQCRAVFNCSHLFWSSGDNDQEESRDGRRVLECLQKALKIADSCMETAVRTHLFVEILNQYLYYFENNNESVSAKHLTSLIELINTNLSEFEEKSKESELLTFYANTKSYIKQRQEDQANYRDIEV